MAALVIVPEQRKVHVARQPRSKKRRRIERHVLLVAVEALDLDGLCRSGALACSVGAHLDAARLLLWCPRQPQREHTLFQLGLNAGGIDLLWQLELPEEVR